MKRKIIALLSVFLIAIIVYYAILPFLPLRGNDVEKRGFVGIKSGRFVVGNKPFNFVGANVVPESFSNLSSKEERRLARDLVASGTNSGINVFRVVAEKEVNGKTVPVEELVRRCEVYGCYVLIAFDEYRPGMDFEEYKDIITDYVLRFRESKAVFAWEIFSIHSGTEPVSKEDLEAAGELVYFVNGLDPNHLVAMGGSGLEIREGTATATQYKLIQALGDFCIVDYDSENVDLQLVSDEEALNRWKGEASAFLDVVKECNKRPVLMESFGFRSDLGRSREGLYQFMLFEAKSRNIAPVFSFWGPSTGEGTLSVYTYDLDVISEIGDFYS